MVILFSERAVSRAKLGPSGGESLPRREAPSVRDAGLEQVDVGLRSIGHAAETFRHRLRMLLRCDSKSCPCDVPEGGLGRLGAARAIGPIKVSSQVLVSGSDRGSWVRGSPGDDGFRQPLGLEADIRDCGAFPEDAAHQWAKRP